METRWVVSARHRRRHWERICSILISERKGKEDAKRLEMALNHTCVVARQHRWMTVPLAVFGCDCTICDCIYVVICDTYIFGNKFTSFLLICVAWVWKILIKIYNLDQRIATIRQQQWIKRDDLIHYCVPDKKTEPDGAKRWSNLELVASK